MEVWGGNRAVDSGVVMAGLDAWVYSRPYEGNADGGGDVYYVSSCATGRITRLLVADVSGHGRQVSDVGTQLRTLMRRYVNYIDQSRFVADLNREFTSLSNTGLFATAVVTTFWGPTGALALCNAGHPPPLLYRAAKKTWTFIENKRPASSATIANIPLGILDLADYEQFDVNLGVGDMVLCYTDSLPESQDGKGDFLGQEGLLDVIRTIDPADPARVVPLLLDAIVARAPGNLTADDVTCLLFRPNGMAPRVPIRDRMLAPFRILRGVASAMVGRGPMPFPQLTLANVGGALFGPLGRMYRGKAKIEDRR
jgi:sigma-B regulation protein RsbU (phosphoserine phosphatase)